MPNPMQDLIKKREALDAARKALDAEIAAAAAREQALADVFAEIDRMIEQKRVTVQDITNRYCQSLQKYEDAAKPKQKAKEKKFRNPNHPHEEWSGVGKSVPLWFRRNLENGVMPWDMLIDQTDDAIERCKSWFAQKNAKARASALNK